MKSYFKFAFLSIALIFMIHSASASYISLNATVTSQVEKDTLKVLIAAINKGDEAAYDVQAEVRLGDKKVMTDKQSSVGINETYKITVAIPLKLAKPGQYPLAVVMHYADANQYPFSALTVQTFAYKTAAGLPDIFGKIKSIVFWKEGRSSLLLKTLSDFTINVTTYLIVPREITVKEGEAHLILAPQSEQSVNFSFENFSALNGSTYQIFAISEYETADLHQTAVTPGTLKIVEKKEFMGIEYAHLVIILLVLVGLFAAFQIIKK